MMNKLKCWLWDASQMWVWDDNNEIAGPMISRRSGVLKLLLARWVLKG